MPGLLSRLQDRVFAKVLAGFFDIDRVFEIRECLEFDIVVGKKLGSNAHAAITTRGFSEMVRFGMALGGKAETLTGLSGLGDLILTCGSPQSRNMSLGLALGEGKTLDEVLGARKSVSEGVYTASAVVEIAQVSGLDLPICAAVQSVVSGEAQMDRAIEELLSRPLRAELM